MREMRKGIYGIAGMLVASSLLFSCGQSKGRYEIDTLIDDYVAAAQAEAGGKEEIVDLASLESNRDALEEEFREDSVSITVEEDNEEIREEPRIKGTVLSGGLRVKALGRLAEVFNDSNYRQYAYAEKLGISPINNIAKAYHTRRPMIKIESNSDYSVDELTHSLPYLVPEASRLLSAIGRNFQDSLKKKGNVRYRVRVTSLLRTPASVKKLRRVNVNATDSSTHQFGTTFDLSYRRFHCLDSTRQVSEEALKNVLAEVLYDLRKEGRCLVKFERKTGCFHVTVTD